MGHGKPCSSCCQAVVTRDLNSSRIKKPSPSPTKSSSCQATDLLPLPSSLLQAIDVCTMVENNTAKSHCMGSAKSDVGEVQIIDCGVDRRSGMYQSSKRSLWKSPHSKHIKYSVRCRLSTVQSCRSHQTLCKRQMRLNTFTRYLPRSS